jgi:hypothetical protein
VQTIAPKIDEDSSGLLMLENQSWSAPDCLPDEGDSSDILVANERIDYSNKINTFQGRIGIPQTVFGVT